jgi:hypothetical protein
MDMSNIYVAMCGCEELQEMIPLSEMNLGDYVAVENDSENNNGNSCGKFTIGILNSFSLTKFDGEEEIEDYSIFHPIKIDVDLSFTTFDYWFIKLYSQSELQSKIMENFNYSLFKLFVEFNHFYVTDISGNGLSKQFDSPEKCWLSFYMKLSHSKLWDGKKWEKI